MQISAIERTSRLRSAGPGRLKRKEDDPVPVPPDTDPGPPVETPPDSPGYTEGVPEPEGDPPPEEPTRLV